MKTEMSVYLSVTSEDLNIFKITSILGVKPTATYKIGDKIGKSNLKRKVSGWEYEIKTKKDFELEKAVLNLIKKLKGEKNLKKIRRSGYVQIICVFYNASSRDVSLELSPKTIKLLSQIGCALWIDYY